MPELCEDVHSMLQSKRCEFVTNNNDCLSNIYLVNYMRWHYCYVDERNKFNAFWSVLAMILVLTYVFWMMQFAVLNYFCPCLKVIADGCRLSQNAAGVTLLTVANGSPDLFMSIAARLVAGKYAFLSCMSQAIFLQTFVGGLVMLTNPFEIDPYYYLRDFGFLFLNVAYMDFIFKRPEGIGWELALPSNFILIGYIAVVIIEQNLLTARIRKLERRRGNLSADEQLNDLKSDLQINRHEIDRTKRHGGRNRHLFRQFWHSIFVFDKDRFRHGTVLLKIFLLFQLPIDIIIRLLIPVVDVEKPLYNWSKLLFCLQLLIVPTYVVFIFFLQAELLGIPYYAYALMFMVVVTVIVFFVTRTDTTPRFFKFTSALSLIAVITVIFGLLSEVNAMFFALATILSLSPQFAMATVISWAICSNDLVTNIMLAKQGFSKMAYTATFSSPVLAACVFIAMPITREAFANTPNKIMLSEESFGETVCIFLEVALLISLLCSLTTNFQMRRACGFFLVAYYLFFLGVLNLVEFNVIGAYGF
ncbi:hypothetical protein KR059_003080 [Drosophila kikkawai]|nr:hypothetical protein KR059_003080 [Drosophila kikkawai]